MTAYAARRLSVLFPFAPAALLLCLFVNGLAHQAGHLVRHVRPGADLGPGNLADFLPEDGRPVVLGFTDWSFRMLHYAPPEIRARVRYLCDIDAGMRALGANTAERAIAGLRGWSPAHNIELYSEFTQSHRRFRLMVLEHPQQWILSRLVESGAGLTIAGVFRGQPVYDVELR